MVVNLNLLRLLENIDILSTLIVEGALVCSMDILFNKHLHDDSNSLLENTFDAGCYIAGL